MWSFSFLFFLLILGPIFILQSSAEDVQNFAASKAKFDVEDSDPNIIAEKWLNRFSKALRTKNDYEIEIMIDPFFYFDLCGDLYNQQTMIYRFKKMEKEGAQLVYKRNSASEYTYAYGQAIDFTVHYYRAGRFLKRDRSFALHKRNQQLVKGKMEGCPM